VVFNGLHDQQLYPMVCSASVRTGMKLVTATSVETSLQFLCCSKLRSITPEKVDVTTAMNFPPGLRNVLVQKMGWLLRSTDPMTTATRRSFMTLQTYAPSPLFTDSSTDDTEPLSKAPEDLPKDNNDDAVEDQ